MARKRTTDEPGADAAAPLAVPTADPPPAGSTVIVPTAGQGRKLRPRLVSHEYVAALMEYSRVLYAGGLVPKASTRPEGVAVLIEIGRDIGLPATMAVAWVAVINGRPSIYGDAALALIRSSGLLASARDWFEGEGDDYAAVCELVRVGAAAPRVQRFSVADAKRAKLWGKVGPWTEYPERMLMFRAKGFAARDEFPDVLCGLIFAEEARDLPRVVVTQEASGDDQAATPAAPPVVNLDAGPVPAAAPPVEAAPAVARMTSEQKAELDRLRGVYVTKRNLRPGTQEAADAWAAFVADNSDEAPQSLKRMSEPAALAFLASVGPLIDPAAYPTAEPTPPAAAPAKFTRPVPPEPAPPTDRTPPTDEQFEECARLRELLLKSHSIEDGTDEARAAWAECVFTHTAPISVRSVQHLTGPAMDEFLARAGEQLDPFSYPRPAAG